MSSRYKVHDSMLPHFITCTVVGWVDALSRESYKNIICDSLTYCTQEKGLLLHAWVIMSNHIHLVLSTNGDNQIGDIVRDFKKFTAKEITTAIENNLGESRKEWMMQLFYNAGENNSSNKDIQFWQQNYHPIALDTHNKTIQRLEYLHNNPVRSGIVWKPNDYKYSSAIDYYDNINGLLSIDKIL